MPKRGIRIYDPEKIYAECIANRKICYLDHNIWIDLCDKKTSEANSALDILLELRKQDKIIIPLSYSLVSELYAQPDDMYRKRRVELADNLSDGVVLRADRSITKLELINAFADKPDLPHVACRSQAFSYLGDQLGDGYLMPANDTDLAMQVAEFCATELRTNRQMRSLAFFLHEGTADKIRANHENHKQDYLDRIGKESALSVQRTISENRNYEYILAQERKNLFGTLAIIIQELIQAKKIASTREVLSKLIDYKKRLAKLFELVPTADTGCQIYAAHATNVNRRPKSQDFYDIEHARAVPYSDIFATNDGNLCLLVKTRIKATQRFGCKVARGIAELIQVLESTQD